MPNTKAYLLQDLAPIPISVAMATTTFKVLETRERERKKKKGTEKMDTVGLTILI